MKHFVLSLTLILIQLVFLVTIGHSEQLCHSNLDCPANYECVYFQQQIESNKHHGYDSHAYQEYDGLLGLGNRIRNVGKRAFAEYGPLSLGASNQRPYTYTSFCRSIYTSGDNFHNDPKVTNQDVTYTNWAVNPISALFPNGHYAGASNLSPNEVFNFIKSAATDDRWSKWYETFKSAFSHPYFNPEDASDSSSGNTSDTVLTYKHLLNELGSLNINSEKENTKDTTTHRTEEASSSESINDPPNMLIQLPSNRIEISESSEEDETAKINDEEIISGSGNVDNSAMFDPNMEASYNSEATHLDYGFSENDAYGYKDFKQTEAYNQNSETGHINKLLNLPRKFESIGLDSVGTNAHEFTSSVQANIMDKLSRSSSYIDIMKNLDLKNQDNKVLKSYLPSVKFPEGIQKLIVTSFEMLENITPVGNIMDQSSRIIPNIDPTNLYSKVFPSSEYAANFSSSETSSPPQPDKDYLANPSNHRTSKANPMANSEYYTDLYHKSGYYGTSEKDNQEEYTMFSAFNAGSGLIINCKNPTTVVAIGSSHTYNMTNTFNNDMFTLTRMGYATGSMPLVKVFNPYDNQAFPDRLYTFTCHVPGQYIQPFAVSAYYGIAFMVGFKVCLAEIVCQDVQRRLQDEEPTNNTITNHTDLVSTRTITNNDEEDVEPFVLYLDNSSFVWMSLAYKQLKDFYNERFGYSGDNQDVNSDPRNMGLELFNSFDEISLKCIDNDRSMHIGESIELNFNILDLSYPDHISNGLFHAFYTPKETSTNKAKPSIVVAIRELSTSQLMSGAFRTVCMAEGNYSLFFLIVAALESSKQGSAVVCPINISCRQINESGLTETEILDESILIDFGDLNKKSDNPMKLTKESHSYKDEVMDDDQYIENYWADVDVEYSCFNNHLSAYVGDTIYYPIIDMKHKEAKMIERSLSDKLDNEITIYEYQPGGKLHSIRGNLANYHCTNEGPQMAQFLMTRYIDNSITTAIDCKRDIMCVPKRNSPIVKCKNTELIKEMNVGDSIVIPVNETDNELFTLLDTPNNNANQPHIKVEDSVKQQTLAEVVLECQTPGVSIMNTLATPYDHQHEVAGMQALCPIILVCNSEEME